MLERNKFQVVLSLYIYLKYAARRSLLFSDIFRQFIYGCTASAVSSGRLGNLREATPSLEIFMSPRLLWSSLKYYEMQTNKMSSTCFELHGFSTICACSLKCTF